MVINEQVRKEIKKCKTLEECQCCIQRCLAQYKYKTLYSMNYSDYDKTEFYEQIKSYQASDEDYLIVITELKENKVVKVKVGFTNKRPSKPHPIFPILNTVLGNKVKYYEYPMDNSKSDNDLYDGGVKNAEIII